MPTGRAMARDNVASRPARSAKPVSYNQRLYRKRYRIENAFGRLHDGRGIATRYERCWDICLHAIILTDIVIFRI